ncbi:thiol-disulfide oxidoreductase ResA [bacterium BMS3Abin07]|nr:thiol-disulfide oxidoreductase ResA [bacterium BMS3Abin07]HDL19742.1 TlpA family protein disulfide reductase [Nitrospirota bacterium]HDO21731.1 TlpA family protein disulfide reductase [Nitrospirota bacterium]HDZ87265.1 TlpA family protein disulfide reductase [Nitrospirota bacterium]
MKHILLAVALCLAVISCQSKAPQGSADIGQKAPDFTLKDLKGNDVSLSSFKNKVVLLEFWATWCPPCRESIPELVALNRKYIDKDALILAVSVDDGRNVADKLTDFVSEHGITYRVLISDGGADRLYNVTGIPMMFLLNRQHVIVKKYTGYSPGMFDELSGQIDKLL